MIGLVWNVTGLGVTFVVGTGYGVKELYNWDTEKEMGWQHEPFEACNSCNNRDSSVNAV